jgi:hypothetical protein
MIRINAFLAVTAASVATLVAAAAHAMPIVQFDKLTISDQGDYLVLLLQGAQKILVDAGKGDQAVKLNKLFSEVLPGNQMSIGALQFEENLDRGRLFDVERYAKDHNARRLEVEDVMIVTLKKNDIAMPPEFVHVADKFVPKQPLR